MADKAQATEVVESAPAPQQDALAVFAGSSSTNIDTLSPEERLSLLRTQTEAQAHPVVDRVRKLTDYLDVPLKVKKFLVHRNPGFDRANTETGEVIPAFRTIFELEDGNGLSFTSIAATNFVKLVATVMGTLDFSSSPLSIKITRVPMPNVGDTYNFQVL